MAQEKKQLRGNLQSLVETQLEGAKMQETHQSQWRPDSILLFINYEDPLKEQLLAAADKTGICYDWTDAYSGVTRAEFGRTPIEGSHRIMKYLNKYTMPQRETEVNFDALLGFLGRKKHGTLIEVILKEEGSAHKNPRRRVIGHYEGFESIPDISHIYIKIATLNEKYLKRE